MSGGRKYTRWPKEPLEQLSLEDDELDESLGYKSLLEIFEIPSDDKAWTKGLLCSACGFLVVDEYLMCSVSGHMTCIDCWKSLPNLVCEFKISEKAVVVEEKTTEKQKENIGAVGQGSVTVVAEGLEVVAKGAAVGAAVAEVAEPAKPCGDSICGSELKMLRHPFVDNLLSSIHLYCPNIERGCQETVCAKNMRTHYTEECRFRDK